MKNHSASECFKLQEEMKAAIGDNVPSGIKKQKKKGGENTENNEQKKQEVKPAQSNP